ncbi:MAG: ABC transporter ATP-binding protein [Reyranella sp.]|uniref:ABC transporter ATP-binding protein n=1 Tax=Reyranella sp. TaxID=1929291 RepID=UPI003D109E3F
MSDIRLEGVSKRYGSVAAADSVDLAVAPGEFVTILGPSGSGKTTLLSLIAGLTAPTAGRIFIGGRNVTRATAQERNIGLVFQSYALFPHMSVLENVLFPLGVRRITGPDARGRALEALKQVRLEGLENRRPSQLSGGQQQRVALARAVVFKPDILLLDEPLGALDRKLREELQVELKQLQRTLGITTILVTHDQEEALSLSDRIMVLNHGRTQQVASPAEAYLRPANRFVAEFLGIANFVTLADGRQGVVRPERVKLSANGGGGPIDGAGRGGTGTPARVVEAIYLGQMVRYHLALQGTEDGAPAMVAAVPFVGPAHSPGAEVMVSWESADVWPVT